MSAAGPVPLSRGTRPKQFVSWVGGWGLQRELPTVPTRAKSFLLCSTSSVPQRSTRQSSGKVYQNLREESQLPCNLGNQDLVHSPGSSVPQRPRGRQAAPLAATQDTSGGQRQDPCPVLQPLARPDGRLQLRTTAQHCGRQGESEGERRREERNIGGEENSNRMWV